MSGKQSTQYHMGTPMGGSVPADLTPSLALNAVMPTAAPASDKPNAHPAPPAPPQQPPLVGELRCPAPACGEPIVSVGPDGAAWLHVYERQLHRPHKLQLSDLPLAWRCHRCGEPVVIAAPVAPDAE